MPFEPDDLKNYLGARQNLFAQCMKLTGNKTKADDLVQETLMKAWAARDNFQPGTNMAAWLTTIARNALFSEHRKSKRMNYVGDAQDAEVMGDFFNTAAHGSQLAHLELQDAQSEIARLPAEQREALFH